jgi:hypothetical protein
MHTPTFPFFAMLGVALLLPGRSPVAQTPVRLIGVATSTTAASPLNLRQDPATCATVTCPVAMPALAAAYAGGTAYDARRPAVWMTTGTTLVAFDPNTCAVLCPSVPMANLIGNRSATGLALYEFGNVLFISDSGNSISWFQATCPPTPLAICNAPVGAAGQIIGGLAFSDVQKRVYYSSSTFGAAAANNWIMVGPQSNPCQTACRLQLPDCPGVVLGPITGLAYDDCKNLLWATDGAYEVAVTITIGAAGCNIQQVTCCKVPGAERYAGLCLQPSQSTSLGASCTSTPCAACPTMVHATVGDPALGNSSFALTLQNAPAGVPSVMLLSTGSCSAPGIAVPGWCGTVRVPLPIGVSFGSPTGGGVGCTGGVSFGLAVPFTPALCGIPLASQFFLICPLGTAVGTGVSNCLTWMISAS